jgi:hypothetical protein
MVYRVLMQGVVSSLAYQRLSLPKLKKNVSLKMFMYLSYRRD